MRHAWPLLLLVGCAESPRRPPGGGGPSLDPAIAAFSRGEFDDAEKKVMAVLAATPEDAVALRLAGKLQALRGRLREAAESYAKAVRLTLDPKRGYTDGASIEELAWVLYRMDQYAQASQWFGVLKDTILQKKYGDMAARVPYSCKWVDRAARMTLNLREGLPTVRLRVNGKEGLFVVDTGSGEMVLDPKFAKESMTKIVGTRHDMRGMQVEHAIVDGVDAGPNLQVLNVPAHLAPLRRERGLSVDGLIGSAFLSHFAVTFDFKGGSMTLRPPGGVAAGKREVPMLFAGDRYVLLVGAAEIASKDGTKNAPVVLQLNTGRPGAGYIPSETFVRDLRDSALRRIEVAGIEESPKKLDSTLFPQGLDFAFGFPISGLVGAELFRGKSVTLDFERMRMLVD
jgi:hypothetical protein